MITVSDNINVGDLVYVWFSPLKESQNKGKKPNEVEYRLGANTKNCLKLESLDGGYSMTFNRELIETWYGNVRKAK